jgi:hypothetical protein
MSFFYIISIGSVGAFLYAWHKIDTKKKRELLAPPKNEVLRELRNLSDNSSNDIWLVTIKFDSHDDCVFSDCKREDFPDLISGNFEAAVVKLEKSVEVTFDHYYDETIENWNGKDDFLTIFKETVLNDRCVSLRKQKII